MTKAKGTTNIRPLIASMPKYASLCRIVDIKESPVRSQHTFDLVLNKNESGFRVSTRNFAM